MTRNHIHNPPRNSMAAETLNIFDAADFDSEIARAARLIREGELVVVPTETVYGIAASLKSANALARLKSIRGCDDKPLTIHLPDRESAAPLLGELSDFARRAMLKLWPGPIGLTFDVAANRQRDVAESLGVPLREIYDGDSITLRCPDHLVATAVLAAVGEPVVLTVASRDGATSSQIVSQFIDEVRDHVALALDAGRATYSKPSTLLKIYPDRYEIVREGIYDARIIDRLLRTTVLFVCSGNTCRSPMAEALARKLISERLSVSPDDLEKKGFIVASAGTFAMPGNRATPAAVEAVKSLGGDLSRHRSRLLTPELIHQADVIFTMGRAHAQAVMALSPSAASKTSTLDPERDIEDPIGGDEQLYIDLAGQLQELIERRLDETVLKHC